MRLGTRLRTSSALRAAPFALALPLFYYFNGSGQPPFDPYGHAPTITSYALAFATSFAYAVASALGAWEAGALKHGGIWQLAPFRSRYRIAAESLAPVIGLAWLMVLVPATLALARAQVWPTVASLGPLGVGLIVSVAHAVIGFAIGLKVPRTIASPVLAVMVWILVAFSRAMDSPWPRHLSGQHAEQLMFGEAATLAGLWPHVAFTGSLALAACLLWLRSRLVAVVTALVVAAVGTTGAWAAVKDWDYNPKLAIGQTSIRCLPSEPGSGLRVCMPAATSSALPDVRREALSVLEDFRSAGVRRSPSLITDNLVYGRFAVPSTERTWRIPLTKAAKSKQLRFQIVLKTVGFTCSRPDPALRRSAIAWAAHITGTGGDWEKMRQAIGGGPSEEEMKRIVELPHHEQAVWFTRTVRDACER
ncbi:DUF7224 domain-containing protein [Streptomyces sp. 7N604]|uniref:DUF7224 domain-containing protein n=1 Tax=Streptomyces sp. 7N604 TaxID=3457415 RepID=UPI003FD1C51F